MRAMRRENDAKLIVREQQKRLEVEEDKRLMREYHERLDRHVRVVLFQCLLDEFFGLAEIHATDDSREGIA